MGLTAQTFVRLQMLFGSFDGLRMLELGNQTFAMTDGEKASFEIKDIVCKPYFEGIGIKHTSLDLTGKDGSLALDLCQDIPPDEIGGPFFVVTNFGTSEHVDDQYACFRNIHDFCEKGGLMIHEVPHIGNWPGHCRFYYDFAFFEALARANDYKVQWLERIAYEDVGDNVFAVLRKCTDMPFVVPEAFIPTIFASARPVVVREYWKGSDASPSG